MADRHAYVALAHRLLPGEVTALRPVLDRILGAGLLLETGVPDDLLAGEMGRILTQHSPRLVVVTPAGTAPEVQVVVDTLARRLGEGRGVAIWLNKLYGRLDEIASVVEAVAPGAALIVAPKMRAPDPDVRAMSTPSSSARGAGECGQPERSGTVAERYVAVLHRVPEELVAPLRSEFDDLLGPGMVLQTGYPVFGPEGPRYVQSDPPQVMVCAPEEAKSGVVRILGRLAANLRADTPTVAMWVAVQEIEDDRIRRVIERRFEEAAVVITRSTGAGPDRE